MKLYGFPASPNTWKVRALAAQLKMPLEFELVDLLKGAQQTAAFLAINPTGRTPVLVDGDFKAVRSNAILQYPRQQRNPTLLYPLQQNDAKGASSSARRQYRNCACSVARPQPLTVGESGKEIYVSLATRDQAMVAKATGALVKEEQNARCASGAAQISRQRYADARRLHLRGAAVPCARRRDAGRHLTPISAPGSGAYWCSCNVAQNRT